MVQLTRNTDVDRALTKLAETIEISPSKYREAKDHYSAVGAWLGDEDSELAAFAPQIYPQGSFALGTAIRPLENDEYDVDAVCLLQLDTAQCTQQQLKEMIGARLKHPKSRYRDMLDPVGGSRRCWTIRYAEGSRFHLDVLPAIPDLAVPEAREWLLARKVPEQYFKHAIRLTDRKTAEFATGWPSDWREYDPTRSNPRGFAEWFKDSMRAQLDVGRLVLARERKADVQDIEDYEVRTPLQQLVQLLKRHRDVHFAGDDDKPVSIIITTLAARAYQNEGSILEALVRVVPRMRLHVKERNGVRWVENPVNPLENFADKWQESPDKAEKFDRWLIAVERDHAELLREVSPENTAMILGRSYGDASSKAALTKYANEGKGSASATAAPVVLIPPKQTPAKATQVQLPTKPSKPWSRNGQG